MLTRETGITNNDSNYAYNPHDQWMTVKRQKVAGSSKTCIMHRHHTKKIITCTTQITTMFPYTTKQYVHTKFYNKLNSKQTGVCVCIYIYIQFLLHTGDISDCTVQ